MLNEFCRNGSRPEALFDKEARLFSEYRLGAIAGLFFKRYLGADPFDLLAKLGNILAQRLDRHDLKIFDIGHFDYGLKIVGIHVASHPWK